MAIIELHRRPEQKLEFLMTQCLIPGYGSLLKSLSNKANRLFNPKFNDSVARKGTTSLDLLEKDYLVLATAYEDLPWPELMLPAGFAREREYFALVASRKVLLDDLPGLVHEEIFDSGLFEDAGQKVIAYLDQLKIHSRTFAEMINTLRMAVAKISGRLPIPYTPKIDLGKIKEELVSQ